MSGTQGRSQLLQKLRRAPLPPSGWQPFLRGSPCLRLKRASLQDPQDRQAGRGSGHGEPPLERGRLCLPRSPQRPLTAGTSLPWGGLTGPAGKRPPPEVPFSPAAFGERSGGVHQTPPTSRTPWKADSAGAAMVHNVILVFFRRRLSQRPAVEELERRNILKRE